MVPCCTIPDMAKPPTDDLGRFLAKLRESRGLSGLALANETGIGQTLIHRWEKTTRRVNRELLAKLADGLKLSADERRELFRLADLRDAPESARDLYREAPDPDGNLLQALLEVPRERREWPAEPPNPNPQSERAQLLIDAVAWVLAHREALSFRQAEVLPVDSIRWPDKLIKLGIKREPDPATECVEIPEGLLREEMPFLDQLEHPVTALDNETQSLGAARVYRRLLFATLDRARRAASKIAFWSYDRSQELSDCLRLTFTDHCHSVLDVSASVVSESLERRTASHVWFSAATKYEAYITGFYHRLRPIDWMVLQAVALTDRARLKSYADGQVLRDAAFVLSSGAINWRAMREQYGIEEGSEPDIEAQLATGIMDVPTRQRIAMEPWRLAGVKDDRVIGRYLFHLLALVPDQPDSAEGTKQKVDTPARARVNQRRKGKRKRK